MPKNSVDVDVSLIPTLKDMRKVEKDLESALNRASKPLVDSLRNVKVGLDGKALKEAQGQLEQLSQKMRATLEQGITRMMDENGNVVARSARQLKTLAEKDVGVRKLVEVMGGYEKTATILSGSGAQRRLQNVTKAFSTMNDAAFELSRIPAVDAKTNKLLTRLYNSPEGFRKMSLAQQQQIREALALVDMQDRAFGKLRTALSRAGMGDAGAELNRLMRERRSNAAKLNRAASPENMDRQLKNERKTEAALQAARVRLEQKAARSRAVSEEKNRVLQRTGGMRGLVNQPNNAGDIRTVKAGLNRDLNFAMQRAALARLEPKGEDGKTYKAATKEIASITASRRELDELLKGQADSIRNQKVQQKLREKSDIEQWREEGRRLNTMGKLREKADLDEWRERGRVLIRNQKIEQKLREKADIEQWREEGRRLRTMGKLREKADFDEWRERGRELIRRRNLEQKADLDEYTQRTAAAKRGAAYGEAQRLIAAAGGVNKLTDKLDIGAVRSGLTAQQRALTQQVAVDQANKRDTSRLLAELEAVKAVRRDLESRVAELKQKPATPKADERTLQNRQTPRNQQQALAILRAAGGDMSNLDRNQIATVRPYLQDRLKARSAYAEGVAGRQGAGSPEFAKAAASAREYAAALEQLNTRAGQLRPTIGDLGQVVRSFFRYALGYGALYQMLGAVTALGRGLVDLDEQFYNIKAITLSTDEQMRTIEGSIKQVGLTTKFTLNEVAGAAQVLAQAGTLPENIPGQLRAVADFAAATGTSLADSADLLTSFKNVYKDISDGKAADMLTKALNLSKLQGADLKTIISYTAQTAEGYNISAEQLLGAVATLRNVGIKPSTVATGLRQAMLEVFNPDAKLLKALKARYAQMGEDMSEATISGLYNSFTFADNPLLSAVAELKRIGFGGEASSMFARAFDVRAFNPLQALVNNFDQYNSLSGQVGIGQSATEGSRIQLESLRATLENLGAAVIAFSDSVGGSFVRSLQAGASALTEMLVKLTELDTKMRMESGEGLSSTIGQGLFGGVLGAMLGGKGLMNRATGFASGSYLAGSLDYNSKAPEASATDNLAPIALALATFAPSLLDLLSGFKGRGRQLTTANDRLASAPKGGMDGAISTGLGVANLFTSLAAFKSPAGAGGLLSVARMGAGLLARAIPVVGLLYGAYQLLELLGGSSDALKKAEELQRNKAVAAGENAMMVKATYDEQQNRIAEYTINPNGSAKEATTAAQAVQMQRQVEAFEIAKQQYLGTSAAQFEDVREALTEYAKKDFDERSRLLAKLNAKLGTNLNDSQANSLSAQLEALQSTAEAVRTGIGQGLARSVDELRAAIAKGDKEGIVQSGAMQRVIDSMPDMRKFLNDEAEFTAEQVSEMYVEFNRRMAEEMKRGAMSVTDRLNSVVQHGTQTILAVALELGDSSAVDTAIQQLIASIKLAETNSAQALSMLAQNIGEEAQKLTLDAAELRAKADRAESPLMQIFRGMQGPGAWFADDLGFIGDINKKFNNAIGMEEAGYTKTDIKDLREKADKLDEAAKVATRTQGVAADAAVQQRERDTQARIAQRAEDKAKEAQLLRMADEGRMTPEFLSQLAPAQRKLIEDLQNPERRRELMQAGKFTPEKERDGVYKPSAISQDIAAIVNQVQQSETRVADASEKKKSELAKAGSLSDPAALVEIARLQNVQRAAERRGDLGGAQDAIKKIFDLQYSEQQKAVERARIAMEEAKEDEDKDATGATLTYNSELAKLESMRGDMVDKLDQYQKKVSDLELKQRIVETDLQKRVLKKQFDEAISRGDVQGAQDASEQYIEVQRKLTELAKEELAAKGYAPDQIEMEIGLRDELTTSLIDQESAQRSLTQAVLAQADFLMREAGTGPSTGNKAVDGFLRGSGVGFTKEQEVRALQRDMGLYQQGYDSINSEYMKQRQGLTDPEKLRVLDREYLQRLDDLQGKLGETSAELQNLTATFDQQALKMFDPTSLLTKLQGSDNDLRNISQTVQNELVNSFDNLGDSMAQAIINAEDLGEAIKAVVHQTANNIFTSMFKTGFNYLGQQGLKMLGGGAEQGQANAESGLMGGESGGGGFLSAGAGLLGSLFGVGGEGKPGGKSSVGRMTVYADTVSVSGSTLGGEGGLGSWWGGQAKNQTMPAVQPAGGGEETGFFGSLMNSLGGMLGGIGDSLSGAWSGLKDSLGGMFGGSSRGDIGEGMKGGDWAKLVVSLVGSAYGASAGGAGGAAAGAASGAVSSAGKGKKFAKGGMPSRVIEGKRSAKRDNLLATATVGGQRTPINVEADEGILSRKAMALIGGEAGLNAINSGQMPMFSVGGMPSSGYNAGQPVTTGSEQLQQGISAIPAAISSSEKEVNIANIYSEQGFADFVTSRSGRKVIINELKKAGAI